VQKKGEGEKPRMLKTGDEFRQEMEAKAAEKAKMYSNMDAQLSGQNADTIVRDRKGKKLEMLTEFMTQVRHMLDPAMHACMHAIAQAFGFGLWVLIPFTAVVWRWLVCVLQEAVRAGKEVQLAKEQYEWGKGKVQKQSEAERARELEEIKNAPFARSVLSRDSCGYWCDLKTLRCEVAPDIF
jgi:hypothetical protein